MSSGAISAGIAPLGLRRRPRDLATLQACASVGQLLLAERYSASYGRYSKAVGQVLLTSEDMIRRAHYRNARRTLGRLLALGVVPVLNENDAIATDEIRFSGNDRLAALVAHLVAADLLVLLTDVDAVYERNPRTQPDALRVADVRSPEDLAAAAYRGIGSAAVGRGGMQTEVDAALLAASEGCAAVIGAASDWGALLAGDDRGTLFHPSGKRLPSRLLWLAHASSPGGRLHLDAGAVDALVRRGSSLLSRRDHQRRGGFRVRRPRRARRTGICHLRTRARRVRSRRAARHARTFDVRARPRLLARGRPPRRPRHLPELVAGAHIGGPQAMLLRRQR